MSPTDALTLQACLAALAKLDIPLPPDLHQAIRECKVALEQQQPDAVLRLRNLIVQHSHLNYLYETEMVALQRTYQTQERAKNILTLGVPDSTAQTLEAIAAQLLDTNDFKQSTQRFLHQYQRQIKDTNPILVENAAGFHDFILSIPTQAIVRIGSINWTLRSRFVVEDLNNLVV